MGQRIKSEFHKRVGFLPQIGNTKVNEENLCRESEAKKKKKKTTPSGWERQSFQFCCRTLY